MESHAVKLLPVMMMAHNEGKVVSRAVESCLKQRLPEGVELRVFVVANGCTDDTEEVVRRLGRAAPCVELIALAEKGKNNALNRSIRFLREEISSVYDLRYVVFMDADCRFIGDGALAGFLAAFRAHPGVAAVGGTNVPDCDGSFVGRMYRAMQVIGRELPENAISGGGYCIRYDVLDRITFPAIELADDLFLSAKLDGWMYRDPGVEVAYSIPDSLGKEFRKRVRQEICTERFFVWAKHLAQSGSRIDAFEGVLGERYRWTGFSSVDVLKKLATLPGVAGKLYVTLNILIRVLARVRSRFLLRRLKVKPDLDFWQTER